MRIKFIPNEYLKKMNEDALKEYFKQLTSWGLNITRFNLEMHDEIKSIVEHLKADIEMESLDLTDGTLTDWLIQDIKRVLSLLRIDL